MHTGLSPDQALAVIELLATLLVVAVCIGLAPVPCHHPECREAHRRGRARDEEAERKRRHDQWHSSDFPDSACRWCRPRPDDR